MIFRRIVLHNFGLYKGRHEIDLTPPDPEKPIVLFGGLNGGGKTTFLNAIQLALYGKLSSVSTQSNRAYESVLEDFINTDTNPADGAAIELEVQHFVDAKPETIEMFRSWRKSGKSISESFEVKHNGAFDPVMADRWYEIVEGLIPSALSDLFFFDGEKIAALADSNQSSQFIRKGLHDLLGLGLVSTLISDLNINERRKLIHEAKDGTAAAELSNAERAIEELSAARKDLMHKRAQVKGAMDEILKEEEKIKQKYRAMGGDLLDQRAAILAERDRLTVELHHIDQQLREIASGPAPLLLVRELLNQVKEQVQKEEEIQRQKAVLETLEERDALVIHKIMNLAFEKEAIHHVREFLLEDRQQRLVQANLPTFIDIGLNELAPFSDQQLGAVEDRIRELTNHRESVGARKEDQDRLLEGIPDPEGLEGMTSRLTEIDDLRVRKEVEQSVLEIDLDKIHSAIEKAESKLQQIQSKHAESEFSSERLQRIIEASQKAKNVLTEYQRKLTTAHINSLEDLILESFKQLLRKKALVESIEICPDSFELSLFDASKRLVPPHRLSAGERHLLSVAILWGLAKASGRPIPTIIDTPLGRLDGSHRLKLVENYFPQAASQVILLSTDEEITGNLYKKLKPYVGHEYMLSFNEDSSSTEVSQGYEFRGAA